MNIEDRITRIKAKWDGRCYQCGNWFKAGATINWQPLEGTSHVRCYMEATHLRMSAAEAAEADYIGEL